MKLFRPACVLVASLLASTVNAAVHEEINKTINNLAIFEDGTAFVSLNNANTITGANCSAYALVEVALDTPAKRLMYSTLLVAKTANSPVYIRYDDHNNASDCTLLQVNLQNN